MQDLQPAHVLCRMQTTEGTESRKRAGAKRWLEALNNITANYLGVPLSASIPSNCCLRPPGPDETRQDVQVLNNKVGPIVDSFLYDKKSKARVFMFVCDFLHDIYIGLAGVRTSEIQSDVNSPSMIAINFSK